MVINLEQKNIHFDLRFILTYNIRLNKDIRGIMVGNKEIKLEMFADDMTAFLRDHASLETLLNMVDSFSLHSGLKINFEKTEVLFLGNDQKSTTETVISLARNRNITAKKAIKILGVHFTYDQTLWRKLNFDETLKTIKEKLNCWNWRNLTVLGRIRIKSFVIPVFMYRAGLVCSHKEIVKEVNKIVFLYDQIKLYLKNQAVQIESVLSKNVYSEIRAGYETRPIAQARFEEQFPDICLDWHDIYKLPFNVLIDTKSREFQYRILNRYLTTNSFLHKIGLANSPLSTFCKQESESLEHLLIICSCTKSFWSDFITWSNQLNMSLRDLSDSDILFGFWQRKEDYLFINHILALAKQRIYECRNKCTYPSFTVFLNKVSYVHQLEKKLMNSNSKVADQESKWEKLQLFCRGSEN